jgi:hypothetical protein
MRTKVRVLPAAAAVGAEGHDVAVDRHRPFGRGGHGVAADDVLVAGGVEPGVGGIDLGERQPPVVDAHAAGRDLRHVAAYAVFETGARAAGPEIQGAVLDAPVGIDLQNLFDRRDGVPLPKLRERVVDGDPPAGKRTRVLTVRRRCEDRRHRRRQQQGGPPPECNDATHYKHVPQ